MSEECTHDCSNCSAACSSRDAAPQHDAPNPHSRVKKVIGVVSGKGGVGKSMTSALLACAMARRGYHCGILDADITGPSIPKLFGIHGRAMADEKGCWPIQSRMGIDVMSINLLVENEEDPVVWRGPVIAGAVKQFWTDVVWKDVPVYLVGVAVAAVVGYACIRLLKMIADKGKFGAFAYYCWAVGLLTMALTFIKG